MTNIDHYVQQAANEYTSKFVFPYGSESVRCTVEAFAAGAAWQKERTSQMQLDAKPAEFYSEIRDALGTLGEGMAATLQGIKSLQEAGLRGADRGVAVLGAIKDVGEKVEACMAIASNTEEGLAVSIEKLDKLGVEKWREAIKHVEAEGTTEPMHAEVKAQPTDASGLGKLWADVPTKLEEVSDETLHELLLSEQITPGRFIREHDRRHGVKRDRLTAHDVIAMMEKAMLAADEAGVKLDWRVTVGAI